jgi:hypothetical protein
MAVTDSPIPEMPERGFGRKMAVMQRPCRRSVTMNARLSFLIAPFLCAATLAQAADGLAVTESTWQQWQARITVGTLDASPRVLAASLLGDYYFRSLRTGSGLATGGFRATSGVILGAGSATLGAAGVPMRLTDAMSLGHVSLTTPVLLSVDPVSSGATLPYVGLGYTSLAPEGGWGFTADFGLVANNPSAAWGLGRALLGPQKLDDAIRNLRFAPVLQLGVRYTF